MAGPSRILFATVAAGGGHVAPAHAMAEALEDAAPGAFETRVSDMILDLGLARFDARHKAQWRWMLAHPWSARWGQRAIDAAPALTRAVLRRALDAVARAAAERFAADPPDLIVANHGFLAFALARARTRYGLRPSVIVQVTEPVDANALWAEPLVERFVVASAAAGAKLARLGVPKARVDVVGYPVRRAFLRPPERAAARDRLGLRDRFTCLLLLGGEGVGGRPQAIVRALRSLPNPPQIEVIAGRNPALAANLTATFGGDAVVRGFVDDMATHLAAADVVVGKPGGATFMEVAAVGRPLLVPGVAGLNEVRALRFLERHGLGHDVRDLRGLRARVAAYVADPEALRTVSAACRELDLAGQTARLGAYLAGVARHGVPAAPRTEGGRA